MKSVDSNAIERLRKAITEIEQELGISSKGDMASVKERLDALENPKVCPACGNRI